VRVIPRAALSHGDSPLTTGGGMPLRTIGSALPAHAGATAMTETLRRMQGLNPQLDDRSPARLLREGDAQEIGPAVIGAARAFLVGR